MDTMLLNVAAPKSKLPDSAHTERPWRIHELIPDFHLEDVWALPTPGRQDQFRYLVDGIAAGQTSDSPSRISRGTWALRWKLGEIFGWDDEEKGLGKRVASLRDRLPDDLRDGERGPDFESLPFTSLYLLENEWASEVANSTMHGVMHMGWVEDASADGGYRGQMAVYVKTNGLKGKAYMAAIRPFRYTVVYPPMLRMLGAQWKKGRAEVGAALAAGTTPPPAETWARPNA